MFKRRGIHFTCFRNGKILVTEIRDEWMMEDVVMPTLYVCLSACLSVYLSVFERITAKLWKIQNSYAV
jgi:hypothetical protein